MYVIEDTLSATSLMLVYNSIFNLFITNDNLLKETVLYSNISKLLIELTLLYN